MTELWKERSRGFWNEAIRYLRLIGNSGFMFSLYALFLAGGYFYPSFIEWLPDTFPAQLVLAGIFTYLLTRCPLRTFLKKGDLVFLLPLETKLTDYFRRSVFYSTFMQSISISIIFLLLGPLFQDRVSTDRSYLYTVLLGLLIANVWNNVSRWGEVHLQDKQKRAFLILGRTIVNGVFAYLMFVEAPIWFPVVVLLLMVFLYVFYYRHLGRHYLLNWELLLQLEARRLSVFYRFVQSFTDVPYVETAVKKRPLLSKLVDRLVWKTENVYLILFTKAFTRSGEYLGMYLRLLITGGLVMYAFPSEWVRTGVALLFIYMTSVQLRTLWHHLDTTIWPDLYPVAGTDKKNAFQKLVTFLLTLQTLLFLMVYSFVSFSILPIAIILAFGLLLSFYFPIRHANQLQTS